MRTRLIASLLLAGIWACQGPELFQGHRVESQPEAGTFHFSVVAVAPWESSVRDLQPKFEMTEAQALDSVLATTQTVGERTSRTTAMTLAVGERRPRRGRGHGPTGSDLASGDSDNFDEGAGSDGTSEEDQPPVDAPEVQTESFQDLLGEAPQSLDNLDRSAQDTDPLTKYWAASSLFQEVRLLSRSLHYALLRRGYRAYIVRLKLTLLPNARNEPYDALCSLSFFAGGDEGTAPERLPQVVPILVTDDLERSKHSRRVDDTREIGLALSYLEPLASSGASLSDLLSKTQTVAGNDLNSLFTVTRLTDNTLGVRLGAAQQASSNFAMIPQNHTVSALLLVPEGEGALMEVIADARFVDTETGVELPLQDAAVMDHEVQRVLGRANLPMGDQASRTQLLAATRWNDWRSFSSTLKGTAGPESVPRRSQLEAWQQLAMVASRSGLSVTTFDLPTTVVMTEATSDLSHGSLMDQQTVATDNGTETTIRVRTGELPYDSVAVGVLHIPAPIGAPVELLPKSVHFSPVDKHLEFCFDSLASWGASPAGPPLELELELNGHSVVLDCQYRPADEVELRSLERGNAELTGLTSESNP